MFSKSVLDCVYRRDANLPSNVIIGNNIGQASIGSEFPEFLANEVGQARG